MAARASGGCAPPSRRPAGEGGPREGDDVRGDVENLRGRHAADSLTGNAAANSIYGGDGGDEIIGGGGRDFLSGEGGPDHIGSRDDAGDSVYCGSDLDTALSDPFDTVSSSCEIRSQLDDPLHSTSMILAAARRPLRMCGSPVRLPQATAGGTANSAVRWPSLDRARRGARRPARRSRRARGGAGAAQRRRL